MKQKATRHADCLNFAPVDVTKGACHVTNTIVSCDDACCAKCDQRPRCAVCAHFAPGERAHLGTCKAGPRDAMAYPELNALKCETFTWKNM